MYTRIRNVCRLITLIIFIDFVLVMSANLKEDGLYRDEYYRNYA